MHRVAVVTVGTNVRVVCAVDAAVILTPERRVWIFFVVVRIDQAVVAEASAFTQGFVSTGCAMVGIGAVNTTVGSAKLTVFTKAIDGAISGGADARLSIRSTLADPKERAVSIFIAAFDTNLSGAVTNMARFTVNVGAAPSQNARII